MEMDRVKEVLDTHVPDGRDFDVKPLVPIVEDIMKRATFLGGVCYSYLFIVLVS